MPAAPLELPDLDPFDLPDWLGTGEVAWAADSPLTAVRVAGRLTGVDAGHSRPGADDLGCDLLAVDAAYPGPVVVEALRVRAHRAWHHGQVLVLGHPDHVVLAAPGHVLDAGTALAVLARLALAVGAEPTRWSARLRLGPA